MFSDVYVAVITDAEGLTKALELIPALRERFWNDVAIPGGEEELNPWLEKAGRVADFLEFAEVMVHAALEQMEEEAKWSAGGAAIDYE